jgi:hypothetical protein
MQVSPTERSGLAEGLKHGYRVIPLLRRTKITPFAQTSLILFKHPYLLRRANKTQS